MGLGLSPRGVMSVPVLRRHRQAGSWSFEETPNWYQLLLWTHWTPRLQLHRQEAKGKVSVVFSFSFQAACSTPIGTTNRKIAGLRCKMASRDLWSDLPLTIPSLLSPTATLVFVLFLERIRNALSLWPFCLLFYFPGIPFTQISPRFTPFTSSFVQISSLHRPSLTILINLPALHSPFYRLCCFIFHHLDYHLLILSIAYFFLYHHCVFNRMRVDIHKSRYFLAFCYWWIPSAENSAWYITGIWLNSNLGSSIYGNLMSVCQFSHVYYVYFLYHRVSWEMKKTKKQNIHNKTFYILPSTYLALS